MNSTPKATITFHLPQHRETALRIENNQRVAAQAYDDNISAYLRFLEDEAGKSGYLLTSDTQEGSSVYSIEAANHDLKTAAHDWLDTQPDIWNWIP